MAEAKSLQERLQMARSRMKNPPMNGIGQIGSRKYPYSTLADVLAIVLPPLNEVGVRLSQGMQDDKLVTIAHLGDENTILDVRPVNQSGTPQEQGSAETYARRYALCTVFCLVGQADDDGACASQGHDLQAAKERVWAALCSKMNKEQAKAEVEAIKAREEFQDTPEYWGRIAHAYEVN